MLIKSLVISHLLYYAPFSLGISNKLISRMESVIHAAYRLLHGLSRRDSVSLDGDWMSFQALVTLRTLVVLHNIFHRKQPPFLASSVSLYLPPRELQSADINLLQVKPTRTAMADRAFSIAGARLWNSLPNELRREAALGTFKDQCSTWLFSLQ